MLIAQQTYDRSADLDPEEAADTYAQEMPADWPGMPEDPEPRDGELVLMLVDVVCLRHNGSKPTPDMVRGTVPVRGRITIRIAQGARR